MGASHDKQKSRLPKDLYHIAGKEVRFLWRTHPLKRKVTEKQSSVYPLKKGEVAYQRTTLKK